MNARFETAEQVASLRDDTDENWKSCKHCGCYSFRHHLKTQSLTGLAGDPRLKGFIVCKNCGQECQLIKQNLMKHPDTIEESRRFTQFRSMLDSGL